MELRLDDDSVGQYQTHEQILQAEIAHFEDIYATTVDQYIQRMRQATDEVYTLEYETEDRERYNELRTNAINRANTYRNDLHNYARALLRIWNDSGVGPLL